MPRDQSRRAGATHDVKGMICGLNAEVREAVISPDLTLAHNAAAIVVAQDHSGGRIGADGAVFNSDFPKGRSCKTARIAVRINFVKATAHSVGHGIFYFFIDCVLDVNCPSCTCVIVGGCRSVTQCSAGKYHTAVQYTVYKSQRRACIPNKSARIIVRNAVHFFRRSTQDRCFIHRDFRHGNGAII